MERRATRQSNIELLRIISMLMIVGHHFAVHGGFYFENTSLTGNQLFLQGLVLGGKIGVDLFVLISGYFLAASREFRLEKLVKFWLPVFLYSVVIFLLCALTGLADFTAAGLLEACFPIVSNQWWFAGGYFVMYLLSPLLNRFLGRLTAKRHLALLGVLAVAWYGIPVFTWLPERIRDAAWFVFLYCIAAFLRLHGTAERRKAGTWLGLGALALLLSYGYAVARLYFMARSGSRYETAYFQTWDPLMLLTAVPLLLGFLRLNMRPNAAVNAVAAASFGVYLIHDSNHLRYPLWQGLLRCAAWRDAPGLVFYGLACVAGVFGVCLAVEWLRLRLLDAPLTALSRWTRRRVTKNE